MILTHYQGRLGNIMLHNVGASILAKKFNYKIDINKNELFNCLNPKFSNGDKIINNIFLTSYDTDRGLYELANTTKCIYKPDNDIITLSELIDMDNIEFGIDLYSTSFQHRQFVIKYKNQIKNSFDLIYNDQNLDNIFIHVRLDDAEHVNPGYEYYKKCLENTKYNLGYISSDTPDSNIVNKLIKEFNLILYNNTPINTINFAKDFNKIILSAGTFSWWIGLLSNATEIYYPRLAAFDAEGKKHSLSWHGDIFVYDDWIPMQ